MDNFENDFNALDPIKKQIEITAKLRSISIERLNEEETNLLIHRFADRYCKGKVLPFMWEGMFDPSNQAKIDIEAVSNDDAWTWINEFVTDKVIIFFNPQDEKVSFIFNNGKHIIDIISECYSFEFYLADFDLNYVICFNHHRVLIACGTASLWLKKYKDPKYDWFLQH
jgi:hypothetical protein